MSSIIDTVLRVVREMYPEATDIHVDGVEIDGETAYVRVSAKGPPRVDQVYMEMRVG